MTKRPSHSRAPKTKTKTSNRRPLAPISLGWPLGCATKKEGRKNYKKERLPLFSGSITMPPRRRKSTKPRSKRTRLKTWGTTTQRQRGRGLLEAALTGIELGKSKKYKRMGAIGARGHYRTPWPGVKPWKV